MITVYMNPTSQDPAQAMHPLMPVDASGKPVNVTSFRPGGRESASMTLPVEAFKLIETAPLLHEEVEAAGVSVTPQITAPVISEDQKEIGVAPAPVIAAAPEPVSDEPYYVHMPEKQIEDLAKKEKWDRAIKWVLMKFIKEEKEVAYREAHASKDLAA